MNDPHRGTGRTTQMLTEAVRAAEAGNRVFVIASDYKNIDYMKHLPVMSGAKDLGIRFIVKDAEMRGLTGMFFLDHHAYDTMTKDEYAKFSVIASRHLATVHTGS